MTTFGVTPEGFNRKTYSDFVTEFETKQRARMDPNVDVDPESVCGQFNGIFGESIAETWEAIEGAYKSFDPNSAEGDAMVNLALLTGTVKRGGAPSTVPILLEIEAGQTVPIGSLISPPGREDLLWETDDNYTNPGGSTAFIDGAATATEDGPRVALAGSLTNIVTPSSGWLSVTNNEDAAEGRNPDDTITLRQRRQQQLALRGGSTVDGIAADLLAVDTISDCVMLENTLNRFDPETGLPPNSFEAMIVDDGLTTDNAVAQVVWDSKPTGIKPYGNTFGLALDKNGNQQRVAFSRADNRLVYVKLQVVASGLFPPDGEATMLERVLTKARNTFGIADDVVSGALESAAFTVNGVTDVTALISFGITPTSDANLVIGLHQIARFSSTRMSVEFV